MTEQEIQEKIFAQRQSRELKMMVQLLILRREKHRNSLETEENEESRGRAKECRDLIKLLTE